MAKPIVGWFEVTGKDGPGLQSFYSKLFDWQVNDAGDGSGYGLVAAGEKGIGGGIGASQDGGPGQVTFYVEVDDPAAYLAKAEKLGGHTIVPPWESRTSGSPSPSSPIRRVTWWACQRAPCSDGPDPIGQRRPRLHWPTVHSRATAGRRSSVGRALGS